MKNRLNGATVQRRNTASATVPRGRVDYLSYTDPKLRLESKGHLARVSKD